MYRVVRHPRYLSAGLGVIANTLIINYTGMYVIVFAIFVMGHFLLAAEERELVDRFGDAYRRYQREVPSLIPRWRR
jgi:protein-S-isoprenylcysteine O-methyltransferase Ste14